MAMIAEIVIIWCWIILGLFWLANMFTNKRTVEQESWASRLQYGVILGVAVILLFEALPVSLLSIDLFPNSVISGSMGALFVIIGFIIAIWARVTLGGNWSGNVTFKEDHKLVQHGPYNYVRHPIYSALSLMILGTAISIGTISAFLAVPLAIISFWIKWRREEIMMVKHFPQDYPMYKAKVKALIPFIF